MHPHFIQQQEKIKKLFDELSPFDKRFLDSLAMFGGACSRRDASLAMGFKSISQANGLLDRLASQGFLGRRICSKIEGYPVVYFVTRVLSDQLNSGWYQFRNLSEVLGKVFRYSVATKNRNRSLWTFRFGENHAPISQDAYKYLNDNLLDYAFAREDATLIVDSTSEENFEDVASRINLLCCLDERIKFEIWSPNLTHAHAILENVSAENQARISKVEIFSEALNAAYQSRFGFISNEGSESVVSN